MVEALDKFFDHRRGHSDLITYCTEFSLFYEEAEEKAGLTLNDVAKAHLFLKYSGLSDRRIDDIRMRFAHNLADFTGIYALALRTAKFEGHSHRNYYDEWWDDDGTDGWGEDAGAYYNEGYYDDDGNWAYDEKG